MSIRELVNDIRQRELVIEIRKMSVVCWVLEPRLTREFVEVPSTRFGSETVDVRRPFSLTECFELDQVFSETVTVYPVAWVAEGKIVVSLSFLYQKTHKALFATQISPRAGSRTS